MTEVTTNVADFSDQIGIFDPSTFAETVVLIGLGGIGASLLPTLVTMGVKKYVLFDPDYVEPRNIASQVVYKPADLYRSKAEVCQEYILAYRPEAEVEIHQRLFTADDAITGSVVIGGVDTMSARKDIWSAVALSDCQLYLDGRIGGEHMSLFAVDPLDGDWYENDWLFSDEEASPLPCTERAIVFPAVALGAFMCSHLAKWHKGEELPNWVDLSFGDLFFQEVCCKK